MRTPLRSALGAVLTTVVVLSVPVATLAVPASASSAAADQASQEGARSILDQVIDVFATPSTTRSAQPDVQPEVADPDLTLLLRDLRVALPSLNAADRAQAQRYLARPTDPIGDRFSGFTVRLDGPLTRFESAHFLIHYETSGSQAAQASQVIATAQVLEQVYAVETQSYGFRVPLSDVGTSSVLNPNNPDGKMDVYLADTGRFGLYGYVSSDVGGGTVPAYMVLDNDFAGFPRSPGESLKVTVAHEFFHAVQYAYDANDAGWFLEGTAVWMEDQVYPAINDYLQYLNYSQLRNPRQSLDFAGSLHIYSSVIFWKFLSERFKDVSIIRRIWEAAAVSAGPRNGIQATAAVLKARRTSLPAEFARYGVWNTLPAGTYQDRGRFPTFRSRYCNNRQWCPAGSGALSKKTRSTGLQKLRLNHLVTAPVIIRPKSSLPGRTKLVLRVNGPDSVNGTHARVQVRYKSGKVTTYTISLNRSGSGAKAVPFNPKKVSSAVLTLSNGGGFNSQLFKFRAGVRY